MDESTSTLDIVTLVIAIGGLALAALSLGWQAATFVLSGSRVKVTMRLGAIRRQFGAVTRMAGPLNMSESQHRAMQEQGFTEYVVVADVRNTGRLAVSVEDVTATTDDGWGFSRMMDPGNPTLPHRLEPGAKESWHVELLPLQMVVDNDGKPRRVRMTVELGTGKVMRTKRSLPLGPRPADTTGGGTTRR